MPHRKRILIADDHNLILGSVANMLEPQYELIGQASDGRDLVTAAKELRPDVVIPDIGMPELNGIEAERGPAEIDPQLRFIS